MNQQLKIFSNAHLPTPAIALLREKTAAHQLLLSTQPTTNLIAAPADPLLSQATIAFGQPDPQQIIDTPTIKWIHLTSAGYTRYDTDAFRAALQKRGAILTNSSSVYSEPCAQHVLAMMLALSRQLPQAHDHQRTDHLWNTNPIRRDSYLLCNQSAVIFGYGAIARRLIEMLQPLGMKLTAVRRHVSGNELIPTVATADSDPLLSHADHIINILPASPSTDGYFNPARLAKINPTAIFYNIGRGSTVDQPALQQALQNQKLATAYLDVTTPEPLPPDHPLWTTPNCHITPHTAGGHATEFQRLVHHFTENLERYTSGTPLKDLVIH